MVLVSQGAVSSSPISTVSRRVTSDTPCRFDVFGSFSLPGSDQKGRSFAVSTRRTDDDTLVVESVMFFPDDAESSFTKRDGVADVPASCVNPDRLAAGLKMLEQVIKEFLFDPESFARRQEVSISVMAAD